MMIKQDSYSRRHLGRNILICAAASAGLMVALWSTSGLAADPDVAAFQAVAADTVFVGQTVGVLPGAGVTTALTATEVDRLARDAEAAARSHYAGPLLTTRLAQFKEAAAAQVAGQPLILDGGVKDLKLGKTTVRGDTATVKLRATTWLKLAAGDKVATPTNTEDFTFELAKINGHWYVTAESFDYLPGQGP